MRWFVEWEVDCFYFGESGVYLLVCCGWFVGCGSYEFCFFEMGVLGMLFIWFIKFIFVILELIWILGFWDVIVDEIVIFFGSL